MSFTDVTNLLEKTQVVAIVTTRANGDPVATPIWSMVVDGEAYLRSAFGESSWWYRHVRAGRPVAFAMGDGAIAERDRDAALALPRERVSTSEVTTGHPVQQLIDTELLRKYAGAPQTSIDAMLSAEARACTLRVDVPSPGA
ncbi:DUF2255 family protein [Ruania alba]|uniref:Pyridoxamine 5'-phosphate oxidase putative domain-containing protein n=1 Tax=Ruania alba TaxID=648782 RepID=A0A1H5GSS5_9MICO|nr:DUF2255 family protein [Ruania alba]SEE18730.1 hypothetical protein SAMN04488554_1746 [Ruania alba]